MQRTEVWRAVVGFEGLYEVSDHGEVRSLDRWIERSHGGYLKRGRVLKPYLHTGGHLYVNLCGAQGRSREWVHRLVLAAFLGPRPEGMEACHNDGDPVNNAVSNLRWDTKSSNRRDRIAHGTDHEVNKTHCPQGHPLSADNLVPSSLKRGRRGCLTCSRERARQQRNA